MIFAAFYTEDALYRAHAELLRRSIERLGLTLDTESIPPRDWLAATAYKPRFLARMRAEHAGPLVYVDADAFVHADPAPALSTLDADIAVHSRFDGEMLTGTILLNDTPEVRELLDEWTQRMLRHPEKWDQVVLQELLEDWGRDGRIRTAALPAEYTCIFDIGRRENPDVEPVIEHLQASREIRLRRKNRRWFRRLVGLLKKKPDGALRARRKRVAELATRVGMSFPFDAI